MERFIIQSQIERTLTRSINSNNNNNGDTTKSESVSCFVYSIVSLLPVSYCLFYIRSSFNTSSLLLLLLGVCVCFFFSRHLSFHSGCVLKACHPFHRCRNRCRLLLPPSPPPLLLSFNSRSFVTSIITSLALSLCMWMGCRKCCIFV